MKAIVQDEYGSADVLRFEDVEAPVAGKGEVLLHVGAASAFIGDWHIMTGTPYAPRGEPRAPGCRVLTARHRPRFGREKSVLRGREFSPGCSRPGVRQTPSYYELRNRRPSPIRQGSIGRVPLRSR
jgi:hypothetical protein